jgi:heavy metal sensor kinase
VTKPRPKSIQFRLTASYTAILAVTFALIGIGVWLALNHSIEQTADRELRSRLADVRHYVDGFSRDDLFHVEEEFREEALLTPSAANIEILDPNGALLFHTPGAEKWPKPDRDVARISQAGVTRTIRVGHEVVRVLTAPVRIGIVRVALPIDEFEDVKNGFLWLISLGTPVLLLLAWLGGYWMSGRALRPVDEISSAAARISARDLSARLPGNGAGDELDRLSNVLNFMLDRLQAAFQRITEFTADASHELRTPVAIIQTTAELMQARPRTVEEHVKAWSTVTAETRRIARLIADLLTLARSDAGVAHLEFGRIDLPDVVRTAVEEMRVLADAKGLQLVVDAAAECEMNGDADELRRAICILLDNAIKFTSAPGEIRVVVNGRSVQVSDTGLGIGPDDLPFIFERFYRVSKDRSRQTGGAGLGLSIAHWIVEKHGGRISVESKLGEGSAFKILML